MQQGTNHTNHVLADSSGEDDPRRIWNKIILGNHRSVVVFLFGTVLKKQKQKIKKLPLAYIVTSTNATLISPSAILIQTAHSHHKSDFRVQYFTLL